MARESVPLEEVRGGDAVAKYPDFEEKCGYGSVTGIGGANCR